MISKTIYKTLTTNTYRPIYVQKIIVFPFQSSKLANPSGFPSDPNNNSNSRILTPRAWTMQRRQRHAPSLGMTKFETRYEKEPIKFAPRDTVELARKFELCIQKLPENFTAENIDTLIQEQTNVDLAHDIFNWSREQMRFKHKHTSYIHILSLLWQVGRRDPALKLMKDVITKLSSSRTSYLYPGNLLNTEFFNFMICKYCQADLLGDAITCYKILRTSPHCKPDVTTFNAMLLGLLGQFRNLACSRDHLGSVELVFKQMREAEVAPDIVTLNLKIRAYVRAHEMDDAIEAFREIGLRGLAPSSHSFDLLIRGLCEQQRVGDARGFYSEMKERGLFPHETVCNVFACSLAIEGFLKDSAELVLGLVDRGYVPDHVTYRIVTGEHRKGMRIMEALQLLQEAWLKNGFADDEDYFAMVRMLPGPKRRRVMMLSNKSSGTRPERRVPRMRHR